MVQDAIDFYKPDKPDRNWERMQSRIEYLESERSKAYEKIDQANDCIQELNEEISNLILSID
ncbi:hypothetical protein LKI_01925 [Leuconostoc kimchii IMSNU 11154]|uniref:Uncharacterized protein n=1 Tax=Leuconostoc kimchii (strain IMSNU 11154 / KCTC 2386 / IH25) TaxID=762051 RepID=D5T0X9_LEUKI|nr:hypothetical protein [Leuconostoc kimchii]ADG39928.1 hypothetical protein LKI_01925 [Leuconostoc kimchii IMSNU 11154]